MLASDTLLFYHVPLMQLVQGHHQEMTGLLGEPQEVTVASLEGMGSLSDWWQVFRITQVGQTETVTLYVRPICLEKKMWKRVHHASLMATLQHSRVSLIEMCTTDCFGETRLVLHVPSSS